MKQIEIQGKKYDILTLDFETYYDKDYSLKNKVYNTSSYIRDPKFKSHLVGIKRGDAPTTWHAHKDIPKVLAKIKWAKTALLCHNTAFDGLILHEHYGVHPAFYLDTMSMARGIHGAHAPANLDYLAKAHGLKGKEKAGALVNTLGKTDLTPEELAHLGEYCKDDCDDTYALFCKLYEHIPDAELRLIDLTIRLFCEPVLLLDEERCARELAREIREKQEAIEYVKQLCTAKDLQSNEKFAQLLRDQGVEPPMKISLTTQEPTYAFAKTDFGFVELMEEGPPIVQALCRARVRNKTTTNETRAQRFLTAGQDGQCVPVGLNYCGAHTMRWSGGNKMNLQNLMRGGELRRSLLAPPGYRIVVADSSQIEARMLAWLAGEARVVELFASGEDVYKHMAASIYGVPLDQITKEQRFVGKVCLGGSTKVLTPRGWVPIVEVLVTDMVWDGIEWVQHLGVQYNGERPTLQHAGVYATPDHEILTESGWREWREVLTNPFLFLSALCSANLPSSDSKTSFIDLESALGGNPSCDAVVVGKEQLPAQTSSLGALRGVIDALKSKLTRNVSGNTAPSYQTTLTEPGCSTELAPASRGVQTNETSSLCTTAGEGSQSTQNGAPTGERFWRTSSHLKGGIFRNMSSIAQIATAGMCRAISGLCLAKKTPQTNDVSVIKNAASQSSLKKIPVYDLLSCGPRNRFTVLSDAGPLVVHNCVLGLGYGMGPAKFNDTLAKGAMGPKVLLPMDETKRIVSAYRFANRTIVDMWARAEDILIDMTLGRTGEYGPLSWGKNYVRMPNGLFMHYRGLTGEVYQGRFGRMRISDAYYLGRRDAKNYIYGGLAVENWTQCLARIAIGEQLLDISERYRVITTTHDEIVVLAKEDEADECLEFMIQRMSQAPAWAPGLPLAAEGGHDVCYSK